LAAQDKQMDDNVTTTGVTHNIGKLSTRATEFGLKFTFHDNTARDAFAKNKIVKKKDFFCVFRIKAREGTDTKAGLKLFTKVGRTIIALAKNFGKIDFIPVSEILGSHMPKYVLIDGYYCIVFNPKPKYYKQLKPME